MPPLLEVEGVSRHFGGVVALDELDFALEAGELCSIIGPNGCGKTTLFNVVTGALAPSAGRVLAAGTDITNWKPFRIARTGICRKFQVPGIYPSLSVAENLEVPLTGTSGRWRAWRLLWHPGDAEVLAEMLAWCGLAAKSDRPAGALSHGEKQWLEIAMQLATGGSLILLDEPTAGMSVSETARTAEIIRKLRDEAGKSVLVIEHDMTFVELLDCRVAVMMRGRIICEGTFRDGADGPPSHRVLSREYRRAMLTVEAVAAGYLKGSRVLEDLSFTVERGEIVAVIGRNGMGKTTLVKTIAGHLRPETGTITFDGRSISGLPPHRIANLGVGYVPQGREILGEFSVTENLLLGVLGIARVSNTLPEWAFSRFPVLAERRGQRAGTLSGGQQQQLAIMRALVGEPKLLLLDEPSEGIQPSIVQEIGRTVREIARERELTVLLVEQNLDFVRATASRCLFVENGRVAEAATVERIRADQTLIRRYLSV